MLNSLRRAKGKLRRALSSRRGIVRHSVGNFSLELPHDHALPEIRRRFPQYSMNVSRVVKTVMDKYPNGVAIDIGANVGDTAAFVRGAANCPILCIEGCDKYLPFLYKNVASMHGIEIEPVFVNFRQQSLSGIVVSKEGTSRIVVGEGVEVSCRSLVEILADHPKFVSPALIKVDTDGFDVPILLANLSLLEPCQATLFFEYDPCLWPIAEDQAFGIFGKLRQIGYGNAMFYENNGDYLVSASLDDERTLEDLHAHVTGRDTFKYWDVAVFKDVDLDRADALRKTELANRRG